MYFCLYDGKMIAEMLTSLVPQALIGVKKTSWCLEEMKSTADQALSQNLKFKMKKNML